MLIEGDTGVKIAQQLGQQPLALLHWMLAQVLAVQFDQIERA